MGETIAKPHKTIDKIGILIFSSISVATIALYFVPFGIRILYPFIMLYAFIHELGHAYTAILSGWNVEKIEFWIDGSGVSQIQPPSGASQMSYAMVAIGGIVLPIIVALICLIFAQINTRARVGLYAFTAFCAISTACFIRDMNSLILVATYSITALALAKFPNSTSPIPRYAMLSIAISLLTSAISQCESLFSTTTLTAAGEKPSDVAQIATNLPIPIWLQGSIILISSAVILFGGIYFFFRQKS